MIDWRDPKQYPDPADTSLQRWAWEFLRRNPTFEAEARAAVNQWKADEPLARAPLLPVLKKWGVVSAGAPVRFDVAPRLVRTSQQGDEVELAFTLLRADRLLLEFDLDAPLDPQIERARQLLVANQRLNFPALRRQRNQTEKFPLYLRVLDALAAGATHGEMLKEFQRRRADAVDERTLRYWIKRATALRGGGNRELLKQ